MPWSGGRAAIALVLSLLADFSWAGNTTCASGQLDWYSSVVGESPCATYQRLRQICNIDYQVPSMSQTPPGDTCNDQVSDCCCNTVAFQLSMLCLNCQADASNGAVTGVDAAPGTFEKYLSTCNTLHIDVLPQDIQHAVCNLNIRLDNFLYSHWDDGSCKLKPTFGQRECSQFGFFSKLVASTAVAAISNNVPNSGTVAGIVVSILVILALGALALWLVRRRRRNDQMRASRPYRWTAAHPQTGSDRPTTREYATASPVSTLDIYPTHRPRLVFSPEAMVRGPTPGPGPATYEIIRGRTPADLGDTDRHSRDDSRVHEPTDDAPDPALPLVPLRLQTPESQGRY
ncbi:hypothetical protein V8D89_005560 [Ganoderma adspersum]